jgi:hypothetical protein
MPEPTVFQPKPLIASQQAPSIYIPFELLAESEESDAS